MKKSELKSLIREVVEENLAEASKATQSILTQLDGMAPADLKQISKKIGELLSGHESKNTAAVGEAAVKAGVKIIVSDHTDESREPNGNYQGALIYKGTYFGNANPKEIAKKFPELAGLCKIYGAVGQTVMAYDARNGGNLIGPQAKLRYISDKFDSLLGNVKLPVIDKTKDKSAS